MSLIANLINRTSKKRTWKCLFQEAPSQDNLPSHHFPDKIYEKKRPILCHIHLNEYNQDEWKSDFEGNQIFIMFCIDSSVLSDSLKLIWSMFVYFSSSYSWGHTTTNVYMFSLHTWEIFPLINFRWAMKLKVEWEKKKNRMVKSLLKSIKNTQQQHIFKERFWKSFYLFVRRKFA